MVEIQGLRALRYAPLVTGALDSLVAPPYDVIGAGELRRLWERSPYNIVRLILPAGGQPAEQREQGYRLAAERLQAWKQAGALAPDPRPALYLYRQRFTLPGGEVRTRQGFFGLVRLTEWGEGIYRHEQTLPGPVSDRIRLIEASQANLSSIFGLYSDPQCEVMAALEAGSAGQPPVGEVSDEHGVWHGLWRVDDAATIAQVATLMRERPVVVADGHHRYTATLEYQRRRRAVEDKPGPWDYCLFYFAALEDPGLVILPTHQALHSLQGWAPEAFVARLQSEFTLSEHPSLAALQSALAAPEREGKTALGMIVAGPRYYLLEAARPVNEQAPEEALDVSVLRRRLVDPLLQQQQHSSSAAELEAHLRYTHDAEEAAAWASAGEVDVAFILRPTPLEQVRTVALAHRLMPQKSTYFWPKLLSGLLIYDHTV